MSLHKLCSNVAVLFAEQLLQFSSVNYNLSMYALSQLKEKKEKKLIKNLLF